MKKLLLFLLVAAFTFCQAQVTVGFSPIISSGLTKPLDIVNAKDGTNRLFFVQQNGIVRIYTGGVLQTTPFLDISSIITYDNGGERGLLSLAFHPQYATNGYFFIYYNNSAGNVSLAQYHVSAGNPNVADPASGKVLLTTVKPFTNHNGCQLLFGPDGNLYFGTGDGGSGGDPNNNAQNGGSRLGKMIRINVDNFTDATEPYYDIPTTNPFINTAGYLPEIYAIGLRNPWRWSFDRQTNDLWIADVGQDAWEEVNVVPLNQTATGLNFGWRCYEATHTYNVSQCGATPITGKTAPIFEYPHNATGGYSITGGYVYRGTEYPGLQGYYICCDYVTTNGWLIKPTGTGTYNTTQQTNFPANIVSFGEAEDGTLYAASLGGTIYKVIQSGALPIRLLSFSGQWQAGQDVLSWTASVDAALQKIEIEQSADGTRFFTVGNQLPVANGSTANYRQSIANAAGEVRYYRLKMTYANAVTYSAIVKVAGRTNQQMQVSYNSGTLQVITPYPLKQINVFTSTGQPVQHFTAIQSGSHQLLLSNKIPGIYLVQCLTTAGRSEQFKIAIP